VSNEDITFIGTRANPESLAMVLGGHVDFAISKLAASQAYLESGDLVPLAAFATERFGVPPFNTAPTLSELGYKNVEFPMWRAIVGPSNMPKEAADYYIRIFKEMIETPEWEQYLTSKVTSRMDYFGEDARQFIIDSQKSLGL
jgi:putative tricarboxylic transport membrane protein